MTEFTQILDEFSTNSPPVGIKQQIEKAHRIEFNGVVDYYSFSKSELFEMLETATRDAWEGFTDIGNDGALKYQDFDDYFAQIKETLTP